MSDACKHLDFKAVVNVNRLTKPQELDLVEEITGYIAEIRIECVHCGVKMQFLGLQPGCDTQGARVSLDGLEASLALLPEGMQPNPFQRLSYNIGHLDHN